MEEDVEEMRDAIEEQLNWKKTYAYIFVCLLLKDYDSINEIGGDVDDDERDIIHLFKNDKGKFMFDDIRDELRRIWKNEDDKNKIEICKRKRDFVLHNFDEEEKK